MDRSSPSVKIQRPKNLENANKINFLKNANFQKLVDTALQHSMSSINTVLHGV